ncbi:MAG: protein translocase subunit SecD [Kangiellaceae bacterium]|nr:protein translocase subunit SecD [Kangiellaceae bacterium]
MPKSALYEVDIYQNINEKIKMKNGSNKEYSTSSRSEQVKKSAPVNKNSMWQYWVGAITLLLLTLNALPNLFPEKSALLLSGTGIHERAVDTTEIHKELSINGILIDSIKMSAKGKVIVLNDNNQLNTAVELITDKYQQELDVEIKKIDNRPAWLQTIGVEPIKLGLDLSGGVLFVLEVDGEQAFKERLQYIVESLKALTREFKLYGVTISLVKNKIKVLNSNNVDLTPLLLELTNRFAELSAKSIHENQLIFVFSDKEQKLFHKQIMQQSIKTLRGRIEELGITEAVTQRQGANRIRVELPGVSDPDDARRTIGATASLDFYELMKLSHRAFKTDDGQILEVNPIPIFTGEQIGNAQSGRDELGKPLVNLTLDAQGGERMLKFSAKNIGKPMVTVFSEYYRDEQGILQKKNRVISVANILTQLGTRFSITNMASPQAAHELALLLRAGSLNAPITIVKEQTINASLGKHNIDNGLAALALGIGLTLIFMALWYCRLGLIADVALCFNIICIIGLMSLLPGVVLTLPGIAGLVLTVGMAVDTNVIIFERIKEEQLRGRSLSLSVEHGYKNAFATILDANVTTMITALILFSIGYGPIKGFATTLGLGILTSMFTGVFLSRLLTNLFYFQKGNSSNSKRIRKLDQTQRELGGVK